MKRFFSDNFTRILHFNEYGPCPSYLKLLILSLKPSLVIAVMLNQLFRCIYFLLNFYETFQPFRALSHVSQTPVFLTVIFNPSHIPISSRNSNSTLSLFPTGTYGPFMPQTQTERSTGLIRVPKRFQTMFIRAEGRCRRAEIYYTQLPRVETWTFQAVV